MTELRCFGSPTLLVGEHPATLGRRKSLALLVYLAVTGCPHEREALVALLWPEHDTPHAFGYLRTALYEINTLDGGPLVEADRRSIAIADSRIRVDVARFRTLCRDGPIGGGRTALAEAVGLRRETFLRGFALKDAPEFDDWQRETAEDLDGLCREALAELVGCCVRDDDLSQAVARARQLVAMDELDERYHRLVMTALALAGRHAAVESHFARCCRVLARELGTGPTAETLGLHERLRQTRNAPDVEARTRALHDELLDHARPRAPRHEGRGALPPAVSEHRLSLNRPGGVFVERSGRIYIADSGNHRIVRLDDMDGTGAAVFGSHGTGAGQFLTPSTVWVDPMGRIHVPDQRAHRIARFDDMTGAAWIHVGTEGSGSHEFKYPSAVCLDSLGRILVTDTGNGRLVRFDDLEGNGWVSLGGPALPEGPGRFSGPTGLFVDASGWIYVSNTGSDTIVRIDDLDGSGWSVLRPAGRGRYLQQPMSLWADPGRAALFAAFCGGGSIVRFATMTGLDWTELRGRPGGGPGINDSFKYPSGISLDSRGRIYVADCFNDRIVRVDDISGAGWTEYPSRHPRAG